MKISIITVTLNMANTIEQTLLSILSQEYKDLEYIVLDGGSTDGTVEIIKKYEHKLAFFRSAKDEGQYPSIQEGFNMATGEVVAYLNGDDILMPNTLSTISEIFSKFNDVKWITGMPGFLDEKGNYVCARKNLLSYSKNDIAAGLHRFGLLGTIQQESTFYKKELLDKAGGLDLSLKYAADFKLWKDFAKYEELHYVDIPLAAFRRRPGEQLSSVYWEEYKQECRAVSNNNFLYRSIEPILENSNILRALFKLFYLRMGSIISYCRHKRDWVKVKILLSKSTVSLSELVLEFFKIKKLK